MAIDLTSTIPIVESEYMSPYVNHTYCRKWVHVNSYQLDLTSKVTL
jgi:hypothetical protein